MDKYELSKNIGLVSNNEFCEVTHKETRRNCSAKISINEVNKIPLEKLINTKKALNILSKIHHPSILHFIEYNLVDFSNNFKQVIITELINKESLNQIRHYKKKELKSFGWNDSKKYINIYGIASAMSYLHSHNILHCNLNSSCIYFDSSFYPKIGGFDYSYQILKNPLKTTVNHFPTLERDQEYLAPEVLLNGQYSKASDVYSFALIVFEILIRKKPFEKLKTTIHIIDKVAIYREMPNISGQIPDFYQDLIGRCWSHDPTERPSFDEIVNLLKSNPDLINDEEYQNYIKLIESSEISFDDTKQFHQLDEIIEKKMSSQKMETFVNNRLFDIKKFIKDDVIDNVLFNDVCVINNDETDEVYSARIFDIELSQFSQNDILNLTQELAVISQLDHPSINKFVSYSPIDFEGKNNPVIISNFCSSGNLTSLLSICDLIPFIDDTQRLIIIYGIASGMSYLHSHNILHRDLKPDNIFFDKFLHPKIDGFQLSIELPPNSASKICSEIKGTPVYLPPEVYLKKEYSKSSDVYAFSLIVYEVMTNLKPFNEINNILQIQREIVQKGKRPEFKASIHDSYRKLIEKCWSQDPKERPTFDEIVYTLKTNLDFITETVNLEEYRKYVKQIDESNVSFNPTKKIKLDEIYGIKIDSFYTSDINYITTNVFGTETNNISLDLSYVDINNYELLKEIGRGSFSNVYSVLDKTTGQKYAAKFFLYEYDKPTRQQYVNLLREVNSISKINHPSFMKFIGYSPINFNNKPQPVIIMELSTNKSLGHFLELLRNGQELPAWDNTRKLINIYGIASAMAFLHSHEIIHRDLKPDNILFNDYLFPKIIDFGLSKRLVNEIKIGNTGVVGTYSYMAPETIEKAYYDKPCDVYAFAMIVYEIITNLEPYKGMNMFDIIMNVVQKGIRPEIPESIPECYQELIEKCWSHEPKERPTFDEIVHLLKTDLDFIKNDVDEDDYRNYIEYIDREQSSNYFSQQNNIINKKFESFHRINIFLYLNEIDQTKMLSVDVKSINLDKYEKQDQIGSGGFGIVYKVIDKKSGQEFAAKVSIDNLNKCDDDKVINLEREINIISKLNYPSILKFIGFNSMNFNGKPKPTIITEFASNGSLDKIIEMERMSYGNPNWDDTKKLINIYGIAAGMAYLHSLGILHRDLKPGNILLDDFLFPKIADFGLSKKIKDKNIPINSGFKGTCAYSAPEIFKGEYDKPGDVYAFSIIMYEILSNEEIYKGFTYYKILSEVANGYRPPMKDYIPKSYQDLIEDCWSPNPDDRPTFSEIVDRLKNNEEFITDNVDADEFLNYIDFIDEYLNEDNVSTITEINDFSFDFDHGSPLDINDYVINEQIGKSGTFKTYKVYSLLDRKFYNASISLFGLRKYSKREKDNLSRELSIISKLNHPLLVKFIGYSESDFDENYYPVIITELLKKETLNDVIQLKPEKQEIFGWNETKKLMFLYGIASGMSYLHSIGIIHKNLKLENILFNDNLYPKISNFSLSLKFSKKNENIKDLMAKDVYSFSIIAYEIMKNERILFNEAEETFRPQLNDDISKSYRELIEKCMSENSNERPTFSEIVEQLKTNKQFITEKVNKDEFTKYVNLLEKYQAKSANKTDESSKQKFIKVSNTPGKIKEIDENNQNLTNEFLDLKEFELGELISKSDFSKTYKVTSKESRKTYSCKISKITMKKLSRDELINLSREVNIISQLNHPSFLKFIGYSPVDFKNKSRPVIVTELTTNGTLKHILEAERKGQIIPSWDDTKKLINIYGIASGMSYLHSNNILHRDLKPENIYLNDYLFPKIGDFGLSTKSNNLESMTFQSASGMKGTPSYSAPEILQFNEYSKSGDVYAFSLIIYEIITGEVPFKEIKNTNEIFNEVVTKGKRPEIKESVGECYRRLIEICWKQDPNERPSFDDIVNILKCDDEFITVSIRRNDYFKYIKFIDESKKTFDSSKKILDLDEFIKSKSKIDENVENSDDDLHST